MPWDDRLNVLLHQRPCWDWREPPKDFISSTQCGYCYDNVSFDNTVKCEGCDFVFHLNCVFPPPKQQDEWFCAKCIKDGEDCSFRDGNEYDLASFQAVTDTFKRKWFSKRHQTEGENEDAEPEYISPTEEDVEQEFWRLAESPYETVEVEYGADLHTSSVGRLVIDKVALNTVDFRKTEIREIDIPVGT